MRFDRWSGAIFGLVVAAAVLASLNLGGCGGPPSALRTTVIETAAAVDMADRVLESRLDVRTRETLAELLQLQADGLVQSQADGLAWYDRELAPEMTALAVLETATHSLRAVEAALDAWAAGAAGGEAAFAEAAACSAVVVARAAEALAASGLEVPDLIRTWAPAVSFWAAAGCPEEGEER